MKGSKLESKIAKFWPERGLPDLILNLPTVAAGV
jgi:hypothetical protein